VHTYPRISNDNSYTKIDKTRLSKKYIDNKLYFNIAYKTCFIACTDIQALRATGTTFHVLYYKS